MTPQCARVPGWTLIHDTASPRACDDAVTAATIINRRAIVNHRPVSPIFARVRPPGALPNHDCHNTTGGPGRFVLEVPDFHSFGEATRRKLITEDTPKRYPALP
jgi:Protein of unknown function (DUF1194)